MLRRIIQNFLANAIRYAPKGKVLLGVRFVGDTVRIAVWDNGVGIPQDKQALIFKEFERLSTTKDTPGLGLGLAITDRIAKLLKLPLLVRSVPNQGSMFAVDIPRITSVTIQHDEIPQVVDSQHQDLLPLNVLLVDNDALLLKALASQLSDWGCNVVAVTGREQLNNAIGKQMPLPQLIIADYHLDDGDNGVDLVQEVVRQHQWQVPCIICSADPSEKIRQHTSDAHFSFMRKPVKSLALKRLIKQSLSAEVTL